ncbi:FAD/NAD(P)-binding protein [Microbacter sp. GSS18]|nr:FAD/NAD(P)-binding protein [Microbacter sp. GSS18]
MESPHPASIALIGGGPRGVSLIERIGARLRGMDEIELEVHIIDDTQVGAGRIWRTDQVRELCMNTLADAVTLFTDDAVTMDGPVVEGPTMFEWCLLARHAQQPSPSTAARIADIPVARSVAFADAPVRPGFAEDYADELAALAPHSHPSRALYGEYLRWCHARAVAVLPGGVRVCEHLGRVVGIERADGRERLRLADGREIVADAVVAATGWMPRAETPTESELHAAAAEHGLLWVRADSPLDQDVAAVPAGADVIVRGLGMGFFDTMALLTIGRGGRFVEDAAGALRYEPSGDEPVLHATSRRGVPFRAKSLYGSLPPRAPQRRLRGRDIDRLPRPIDFDAELWPLILRDAVEAYYDTLARVRPGAVTVPVPELARILDAATGDVDALAAAVEPFVPDPRDRFDLRAAIEPVRERFADRDTFDAFVRAFVADDLAEAERGADSPLKAGLWSIASARQPASVLGAFGGYDAESRAAGFARLRGAGGMFGSGPPAFRNRQLLALMDAGLVRFIGPSATVSVERGRFRATSPDVAASVVWADVLIDAFMRPHDLRETVDPLAASLSRAGRARVFRVPRRGGGDAPTAGFDVDPATGRLIGTDGGLDPAVHVAGIPVDDVLHDTIISPMPRADATMLRETDRVARSALGIALSSEPVDVCGSAGARV